MKRKRHLHLFRLLIISVTFLPITLFAQLHPAEKDSCITRISSIKFLESNDGGFLILKDSVPDFIKHLTACSASFKYINHYKDRRFGMVIPKYLPKLSFGYGDNSFYYSFNDSNNNDSLTTSIVVCYDLDDSDKEFFFKEIREGKQKVAIKNVGGQKMYLFRNWRNFSCGQLFLDRNTYIFYCTTNTSREQELRNAILTFRWQ